LKISRFTESDLADCLDFLKFSRTAKENPDFRRLKKTIGNILEESPSEEKSKRLRKLLVSLKP